MKKLILLGVMVMLYLFFVMKPVVKSTQDNIKNTSNKLNRVTFLLKVNNILYSCQTGKINSLGKISAVCDGEFIESSEYDLEWL